VFLLLSKTLDVALEPLSWVLALLVLAALLRHRGRTPWLLATTAVALLVAFSLPVVSNLLQRRVEAGARSTYRPDVLYDAVIVLGGQLDADASRATGEPELTGEADRLVRGFELWRTGRARRILLSGGLVVPRPGEPSEAERLRGLLVRWGVPAESVLVETTSRNTRENALETARIVEERGLRTLLLVTSAAHAPRALGCFRAAGLSPDVLPVDRRGAAGGSLLPRAAALDASTSALRELAGRAVYWLAGYVR
jgi:uncharacterized SAM-binding protein YcdF (DUF218 family)